MGAMLAPGTRPGSDFRSGGLFDTYGSVSNLAVNTRTVDNLFSLWGNTRFSARLDSPSFNLSRNDELRAMPHDHLLGSSLVEADPHDTS